MLTRMQRLKDLQRILQKIDVHFNARFNYPIVIFTDDEALLNTSVKKQLKSACKHSALFFQRIFLPLPSHLKAEDIPVALPCGLKKNRTVGYRHMCRFHAFGVYDEPILNGLEYAWRLDDDSVISRRIDYDVFLHMKDNGYTYGYAFVVSDHPKCIVGLWEITCKFAREYGIDIKLPQYNSQLVYYNNFEISKLSFWRSCDYQYYADYIDRLGGIYYYRWGDAAIKTLGLHIFVPRRNIYAFDDIGYVHKQFARP